MAALIGGGASILGGLLNRSSQRDAGEANAALQREFAQQGVRWKVADAKAAGIHPLYALGASTVGASPSFVGDTGVGNALSSMGQDVSRAIMAGASARERQEMEARELALVREREADARAARDRAEARENARLMSQLQNDEVQRQLWMSQMMRDRQARVSSAPAPEDSRGVVDTGAIKLKPAEQVARNPFNSSKEAGSQPMWQRRETAPGVFRDFPHPDTNLDSEIVHAILAAQSYVDKWVSDAFFGGAPKYIQVRKRYEPDPGSYLMDRGYQRPGVNRKGR